MKFYLIDDDVMVLRILENIIEEAGLGEVIGESTDSEAAIMEITIKKPDIVLIDMLMPKKDGISTVGEIKSQYPDIHFVMISQVSTKNMISKAYSSGIEFYINKPINKIEVVSVVQKVKEKITLEKNFKIIENMVSGGLSEAQPKQAESQIRNIRVIFSKLGKLTKQMLNDV